MRNYDGFVYFSQEFFLIFFLFFIFYFKFSLLLLIETQRKIGDFSKRRCFGCCNHIEL